MNAPQADGEHAPTQQKGQPKALRFVTNYGAPHPKRYTNTPSRTPAMDMTNIAPDGA